MSKLRTAIASALLALLLAGCGGAADYSAEGWTALMMARETAAGSVAQLTELTPGDGVFDAYIEDNYGLDADSVEDGAVLAADGASAREVAVLRFGSEEDAETALAGLRAYLEARENAFTGYMPAEADMLSRAETARRGAWCALIALPDAEAGLAAFEGCFSSEPPEQPEPAVSGAERTPSPEPAAEEPEGWTYSERRIISAYRSGDYTGLDARDIAILEVVDYVLTEAAPEGMSDYERELAIHDYIIENASYDSNALSALPFFEPDPDNTNPYGALVNGRAVCSGYSSAFQLFMDLIGVECITVEGEGNPTREEHAWNMVRLEGDWYCVDVTWDDPIGVGALSGSIAHRYFNVTSDYMRRTHHYWDADGVPEAEGTRFAWSGE